MESSTQYWSGCCQGHREEGWRELQETFRAKRVQIAARTTGWCIVEFTREGRMGRARAGCDWGWQVCGFRFVLQGVFFICGQWSLCWYQCFFCVIASSTAGGLTVTSNRHSKVKGKRGGCWCVHHRSTATVFPPQTLEKPRGCHTCSLQTDISFDPSTPVTDRILTSTHKVIPAYLHVSHLRKTHSHTHASTDTQTQWLLNQPPLWIRSERPLNTRQGTPVWVDALQWGCLSCRGAQYLMERSSTGASLNFG